VTGNVGVSWSHGTLDGKTVRLRWTKPDKSTAVLLEGQYEGSNLAGTGKDPEGLEYIWRAERDPAAPRILALSSSLPRLSHTTFQVNCASASHPSWYTVRTTSVDAGGLDAVW